MFVNFGVFFFSVDNFHLSTGGTVSELSDDISPGYPPMSVKSLRFFYFFHFRYGDLTVKITIRTNDRLKKLRSSIGTQWQFNGSSFGRPDPRAPQTKTIVSFVMVYSGLAIEYKTKTDKIFR